jgi:aryl-alcohol dehydrogenase-like predicted oxidoreductase
LEYRTLGNLEVSVIGLGTLRAFNVTEEADLAPRRQIIDNLLAEDINFIDTAAAYGAAEKAVGITTAGRRDKFYLATKVRIEGKEAGENQIAQSFQNFNTDYIDLLQVHNMIDVQTHLPTLERLKDEGKVGLIGVTAMVNEAYDGVMDLMRTGRIDTVQIPYNVVQREVEERLLPLAEELGIGVMVMEPLKKGRYVKELKGTPDLTPLKELGVETWAQALLAWVVADPRVSITIPATSRPERITENALAGNLKPMPQELRDYVREETVRLL